MKKFELIIFFTKFIELENQNFSYGECISFSW